MDKAITTSSSRTVMVDLCQVSRNYGQTEAVKQIDLQIYEGQVLGLLGQNGAGKSTIMKMLVGALEPSAGTIHIAGRRVTNNSQSTKALIGYLPENCPIYPELAVCQYLDYIAALKAVPTKRQRQAEIRRVMALTNISARALERIDTLSRGYRQRVGVAQALINQPKLLILDEPTNGLDPSQIKQMRQLIKSLARTATVVISTHILSEVQAVCDRAVILRDGRLVHDHNLSEQLSNQVKVRAAAGAEAVLHALPFVDQVNADGNGWQVLLTTDVDGDNAVAEIAQALVHAQLAVYHLEASAVNLETLFVDTAQ